MSRRAFLYGSVATTLAMPLGVEAQRAGGIDPPPQTEENMTPTSRRHARFHAALCFALMSLVATAVSAQDCTGTITAEEAMKAEMERYAAQTSGDFATLEKMLGNGGVGETTSRA